MALSFALGVDEQAIKSALLSFNSDAADNPGRGNLFSYQGAQVMLDFAHKLTIASATIEEADRQALRDNGLSDRDIWDVANVTGFFNMTNRVASGTQMRPNDEYHAQAR